MTVWKACDLRGVYPAEIHPELFTRLGRALATRLALGARVLVAGDFRSTTPELKQALIAGLAAAGACVLDAGQIPTPVAYFAHRQWRTDAALIVTASHNPPDHNGLKLMLGELPPGPDELDALRRATEQGVFRAAQGGLEKVDILLDYSEWILFHWNGIQKGLHVVLDAGNGAWSEIAPPIFETLGFHVERLFCQIDGRYPNRPPDSAPPRNLVALSGEVKRTGAQLGIAWDGDGDRVALVDETGRVVSSDEVAVVLARELLAGASREKVVYDLKLSDVLRRAIQAAGGVACMERSGHAFIKGRMIRENCVLGCEASGHYFFRELGGGDDGLFTALFMADVVARRGPLGALRTTVPPFFLTPDIRLRSAPLTYEQVASRLRSVAGKLGEITVDGLRIETADGFILVRESVTESALTMRMEGHGQAALNRLIETCRRLLPEIAGEVSRQVQ